MTAFISGLGWVGDAGMGSGGTERSFSLSTTPPAAISREDVFALPYKNFGRMDEYSRLGLAAIAFALRDAGLEESEGQRDIGLVAQTEYGCLWTDIDYYNSALPQRGAMASPGLFAYTLPNCFLGEASIRFGLTGDSYILNEPSASGLAALDHALLDITAGQTDVILCGRCDLGRPPLLVGADEVDAGALFFVLEENRPKQRKLYGEVTRASDGKIVFNQENISSLADLAHKCLQLTKDHK